MTPRGQAPTYAAPPLPGAGTGAAQTASPPAAGAAPRGSGQQRRTPGGNDYSQMSAAEFAAVTPPRRGTPEHDAYVAELQRRAAALLGAGNGN